MYPLPRKGAVEQLTLPIRYIPFARSPTIENNTVRLATTSHVKERVNGLAFVVWQDESNICCIVAPKGNHAYESVVISISALKDDFWLITRSYSRHAVIWVFEKKAYLCGCHCEVYAFRTFGNEQIYANNFPVIR